MKLLNMFMVFMDHLFRFIGVFVVTAVFLSWMNGNMSSKYIDDNKSEVNIRISFE